MKNLVLTGYMASGKTTTAKLLSEVLKMEFIDTDDIISDNEKMSVSDIFLKKGEEYFRIKENELSKKLMNTNNTIISTGGGFVLNRGNIDNLRKNGVIIYLNVSKEVIIKRYEAAQATRPLMKNNGINDILQRYKDRKEFYENCDISINIDICDTPQDICERVVREYLQKG